MYRIKLFLRYSNTSVAELNTTERTIARDFIYDSMTSSWHGTDYRTALIDSTGLTYAIANPCPENSLTEAFNIVALKDDTDIYLCIPDAIDKMQDLLEDD